MCNMLLRKITGKYATLPEILAAVDIS